MIYNASLGLFAPVSGFDVGEVFVHALVHPVVVSRVVKKGTDALRIREA
jgi:hypothetical protein